MRVKGSPRHMQAAMEEVKDIMKEYVKDTGQRLSISKYSVTSEGDWAPLTIRSVAGIPVEPYVRY